MYSLIESEFIDLIIENLDRERVEASLYHINFLIKNEPDIAKRVELQRIKLDLFKRKIDLHNELQVSQPNKGLRGFLRMF